MLSKPEDFYLAYSLYYFILHFHQSVQETFSEYVYNKLLNGSFILPNFFR